MKVRYLNPSCLIAFLVVLTITGCSTPLQRASSDQQQAMVLQMQQAFLQRIQNGNMTLAQMRQPIAQVAQLNTQEPASETNFLTEAELLQKINGFPLAESKQTITLERDGLKIGTQMYLDAEGEIVTFAANKSTGDVTYLVAKPGAVYDVKYMRAGSTHEPILIATATKGRGAWSAKTVTGKAISGNDLLPTSKGIVMARSSSGYIYEPGSAIKSFEIPQDYHVANFQNGDIASTGYILLEKDLIENRSNNAAVQLFQLAGSLAKTVTLSEDSDYALMSWRDGRLTTFVKGIHGKNVADGGNNCRVQSKSVGLRKCESLNFREALYEPSGMKNHTHYFWGIHWFNTPEGPFALAQEERSRKVTMTNLATGQKVALLEDILAFTNLDVSQSSSGVIRVSATSRLITPNVIPDALAHFKLKAAQ